MGRVLSLNFLSNSIFHRESVELNWIVAQEIKFIVSQRAVCYVVSDLIRFGSLEENIHLIL